MGIFDESLKKHGYRPEAVILVPETGGRVIHLTVWKPEKKKKAAGER